MKLILVNARLGSQPFGALVDDLLPGGARNHDLDKPVWPIDYDALYEIHRKHRPGSRGQSDPLNLRRP
jgi:hypothetical protein